MNLTKMLVARDLADSSGEIKIDWLDRAKPKKRFVAQIWKQQRVMETEESAVIPLESGAGDGNRTRI
jgi:hypothetical protein